MKKLFYILSSILVIFITSCSTKPEDVVKKAYNCYASKDYKTIADLISTGGYEAISNEEKTKFSFAFVEYLEQFGIGGISSVGDVLCNYNENDSTYSFVVNLSNKNGNTIQEKGTLENSHGKWSLQVLPFNKTKKVVPDNSYTNTDLTSICKYAMCEVLSGRNVLDALLTNGYLKRDHYEKAVKMGSGLAALRLAESEFYSDNYQECASYLKTSLELDSIPKAYWLLGHLYDYGFLTKDYDKAEELFRKALSLDTSFVQALSSLGVLLVFEKRNSEGVELLKKAAEQNDMIALYHLGVIYGNGMCVKRDYSKAFGYYRRVEDLGLDYSLQNIYASALNNLGVAYANGRGVKRNYSKALDYQRASNYGNALAESNFRKLSIRRR